jgi:excisionase family DNA binding protein
MDSEHTASELLTIGEGSQRLRLQPSTLRAWILKRKIPFVKLGGRVFLRMTDCDKLIDAGLRPALMVKGQGDAA